MENKTYIDKNGYLRFKDSNYLVHRWLAYKHHYKPWKWMYLMKFRNYQVHHKDGDKLNNDPANLRIVTFFQHKRIEGKKISVFDAIFEILARLFR